MFQEVAVQVENTTKKGKKTWNEKLLSLYITLPNTYFCCIIALPSCIYFFFPNLYLKKTLMWFFPFIFLL